MTMRTNRYWANRASARMLQYERGATSTINTVSRAYDRSIKVLEKEIEKVFSKYAVDGSLSPAEAKAFLNEKISSQVLDSLKDNLKTVKDPDIRRQLLNQLNAPAYRARITRLQALKEQVYIQSKIIADAEIHASTIGYIDTINDAYYRHLFDIQKGIGTGFNVASMPAKTIEQILRNPWSGQHFSSRVWKNTDVLAEKITETITAGFMSGKSLKKMAQDIEHMSDLGKMAAARLIRTETNYMANAAEMESYTEAEIEEYMFIATLDLRTSEVCQNHDGKIYKVKDAVPGENMPPLHPWCRSTTRAYFGPESMQRTQRRARDPVTGKTYTVPANMDYRQWYQKHVTNLYGADQAEVMKKKIINKAADRVEHSKYKLIFGNKVPSRLEDFQELKYNKTNEWENIKNKKQETLNSLDYRDSFFGKFGDRETREWYIAHDKNIPNLIDKTKSVETQARQAHSLRNKYRTEARNMMKDQIKRAELDIKSPNKSFNELLEYKMGNKKITKDEAMQDIIKTATKTNKMVNKSLGLE